MHPTHYYIKFLILRNWGEEETLESVNKTLRSFGLFEIEETEFLDLVSSLSPPETYNPRARTHQQTIDFLEKEQVHGIWAKETYVLDALRLFQNPRMVEDIQILLLGRFSPEEVAPRIGAKYSVLLSTQTLSAFKHYFWNTDIVSGSELKKLVGAHPLRDAFLSSMYGSKNQALYRAGFNPTVDARRVLKEAHRSIYFRIEATRRLPDSKDTARMLATLSKELVAIHNTLHAEGAGVEEMMKELKKFVMEKTAGNVVSIKDIAPQNNFSHGGTPKKGKEA